MTVTMAALLKPKLPLGAMVPVNALQMLTYEEE